MNKYLLYSAIILGTQFVQAYEVVDHQHKNTEKSEVAMQANTQEYSLPKPGRYRHFRNGQLYQVLSTARHSETLEPLIVYQALYGTYGIWVRPAKMFLEEVAGPDGEKTPRFIFVGPGAAELPALH